MDDQSTGWLVTKWTNLTDDGQSASNTAENGANTDYPLFRLADVYLMYGEAVARGGQGGNATTAMGYVNELRERAFGDTSENVTEADLNTDFYLDERCRELYWESTRRTDLIRFNRFTTADKLWEWKGEVIRESGCAYGKFFRGKAGFVSKGWWPDFCNWRRRDSTFPAPGSIEEAILLTLKENGSLITRDLRALCGFTGPKMRSRFDSFLTRLQMSGYIVTEDFVYPRDKHGRQYGWGWSLLTRPEELFGRVHCGVDVSPEESYGRIKEHFSKILPHVSDKILLRLIG